MTQEQILSMCERSFSPQVTMEQIVSPDPKTFLKWNVHHQIQVIPNEHDECVGMIMKMNNSKYDEFLMITLSWDDTYRLRFMNGNYEVSKDIDFIFCDQLSEVIDDTISKMVKVEFSLN